MMKEKKVINKCLVVHNRITKNVFLSSYDFLLQDSNNNLPLITIQNKSYESKLSKHIYKPFMVFSSNASFGVKIGNLCQFLFLHFSIDLGVVKATQTQTQFNHSSVHSRPKPVYMKNTKQDFFFDVIFLTTSIMQGRRF